MKNKLLKLALFCKELGYAPALRIIWKMFRGQKGKYISLSVPGIAHPVYIRAQSEDEYTFQQIFVNREYDFEHPGEAATLIDAGANIGLASVWFANRFPGCRIICLEPEPGNYALLQKNVAPYPNITPVNAGLWSRTTHLSIRDSGLGYWGFTVEECDASVPGSIPAVSLPDLMRTYQLDRLDLVKMDIEGSEKNVLEAPDASQWLSVCRLLVIEIHDRMKKGTAAALFRTLLDHPGFVIDQKGENLICWLQPAGQEVPG